ncbi:germ cell nuclear acidic protein-like [Culicoides brevitarsis]
MLSKKNTRDGSESLFSTDSSEKNSQTIERQLSHDIGDLNLAENLGSQTNEPLLLEYSSSVLDSTLSKDTSYLEYYERSVKPYCSEDSIESYREKGQGGESPEKDEILDDTKDKTLESLAETQEKTISDMHNNTFGNDILSISSETSEKIKSDSTIISLSDSDDECTKTSTQLEKVVSPLNSLNVTTSSEVDKFFNNIPLLASPQCSVYTRKFDPRYDNQSPLRGSNSIHNKKHEEEIIPESDPEPDTDSTKSNSPKKETLKSKIASSLSSCSPEITQINISANVHISIKIDNKGNSLQTDKKASVVQNENLKRKQDPKTSDQPFRAPQCGRSKEKETEKTVKNCQNEQVKLEHDSIEVDEYTSKVLDEIYGKDKWQTPQLKTKSVQRSNREKSMLDFSTFDRNANLESTRITSQKHIHNSTKVPTTNKKKVKENRAPTLSICDPETSSDNESSDESWKIESQNSTDSELTQTNKTKQKRVAPKQRVIRPPSYSDSDDDQNMNQNPTNGGKTKRKLFNPNKTYDETELDLHEQSKENKSNDMDHDINQIKDDALSFCFEFENVPKALDRIKNGKSNATPPKSLSKKINTINSENPKIRKETQTPKSSVKKLGFLQSLDVNTPEDICDPEALRFRKNYKNLKHELTDKLFALYNEHIFENELVTPCSWNKKLLTTAGRCRLSRIGGVRKAQIELSDKVLTSADRLRCTLIHEMCHAATWIFNGEDGHGKTWKAWAHKANMIFKELPLARSCHNYQIFYKYTYLCKFCKSKSQAHSKSKKVENIRCKLCHGPIEIMLNKINKEGQMVSTPVKSATGFAKFVKENYSKVKTPNVKHGEVMKTLGQDFGKLSVSQRALY